MVVIPKNKPVITGMNSYYLKIDKLIDHFNGECESGCILFEAPSATGAIFFDDHIPLSGRFESKTADLIGVEAIEYLITEGEKSNFLVSVFEIGSDMIHFWANLADAKPRYTNLSTEFTDLKALILKMRSEKLTGYVDASVGSNEANARIFLRFGHIIGGTDPWKDHNLHTNAELMRNLIEKAASEGGTFSVFEVDLSAPPGQMAGAAGEAAPPLQPPAAQSEADNGGGADLAALAAFLNVFEDVATQVKRYRRNFHTLLKKKFISKADRYDFLDPFAGEFEYADGAIRFTGTASTDVVMRGVVESAWELAAEMGLQKPLITALAPMRDTHKAVISLLAPTMGLNSDR